MEIFKENIGEMYYDRAVKLMEEVEERKRDEMKRDIILKQGTYRKSQTKREKVDEAGKKDKNFAAAEATAKDGNLSPQPTLDEQAMKDKIMKAGNVFKKFSSLLSRQQEVLL